MSLWSELAVFEFFLALGFLGADGVTVFVEAVVFLVRFAPVGVVALVSVSTPSSKDWRLADDFVGEDEGVVFSDLTLTAAWEARRRGESIGPSSVEEKAPGEVGSIKVSVSGESEEAMRSGELKNAAESEGEVATKDPELTGAAEAALRLTLTLAALALAKAQRNAASWVWELRRSWCCSCWA
jgi:hypothetical protein